MIKDTASQDIILTPQKSKGLMLKLIVFGLITVTIGIITYPILAKWSSTDFSVDSTRIRTAKVLRGDFIRDLSLQGNIIAANSPKLYASAVGHVTLLLNPGQLVTKGDLVALLDSPALTNQLQQEQSKFESLQIELARQKILTKQSKIKNRQQIQLEKVVLDAAKRELRRAEQSLKIQALSQIDYEKAADELQRSQLKYDFAIEQAALEQENLAFELKTREFELNQYRLLVENTERRVEELNIIAPVSGIIGSWAVEQKSAVEVNQALLTIVDLSAFQIEAEIPESYSDLIGIGMPVKVTYNQQEYDASIVTIAPEVSQNIIKARVSFTSTPPPGIKQNQRVSSRVIIEEKSDVLYLPRGSFIQHHSGLKAFVVDNNMAMLTDITLGSSSIDKLEVISGLTQGQEVIISNTDFVKDATVLRLNE